MVDALTRFCTVCFSETYDCSVKVIEICKWNISSIKGYFNNRRNKAQLKKKMKHANSYSEWKTYANEYDQMKDIQIWKETQETSLYDWQYIKTLTGFLREARENNDYKKVMLLIRSNAVRNIANILNPPLYSKSFIGTKHLIEDFQKEMVVCLEYICGLGDEELSREKKFEFFSETRHAFGRTALIFSGGANMGLYHYGVAKCLFEEGLFPRIIAGSSIGSIFASFICTKRMDELPDFLNPDRINLQAFYKRDSKKSFIRKLMRLFSEGHFLDNEVIKEFMRDNIGDVTFQEAYDRTGWILNITATGYGEHDGYRLLNYLTAPNVLIWSAVCASCAIPYIYGPAILYCKNEEGQIEPYIPGNRKFVDGSIGADLPMQNLSELFNVNYFIVSQTNPWVVPFMNHSESYRHSKRAIIFRAWEFIKDFIGSEIKHRINQLEKLGILSSAIARYVNLITQQYGGHVTIWPHPTLNDFIHLLDNPTHEMLRRCLIKGATRVYHKVNHIASVLVVERALERNYVKAKILHERPAVRLYKGVGEANHEESTESNENDTHPDTLFDDVDYMPRNSIGYERKTQAHHPDIHVHSGEHLQNERLTSLGLFKYVEEQ